MKLKPSEVRFWQECYVAQLANAKWGEKPGASADVAVQKLRERLDDPGPHPDEGRL